MMYQNSIVVVVTLVTVIVTVTNAFVQKNTARDILSDRLNIKDPDIRIPSEKRNVHLSLNGVLAMLARMLSASQRRHRVDEYALLRQKMAKLGKRSNGDLLSKDKENYHVGSNKKKLEHRKRNGAGFPNDKKNRFLMVGYRLPELTTQSIDDRFKRVGEESEFDIILQQVIAIGRLLSALRERHTAVTFGGDYENHLHSIRHRTQKRNTGAISQIDENNELVSIKLRMSEIAKRGRDAAARSKAMDTEIGSVCHMLEQMIKHYEDVLEMISNQEFEILGFQILAQPEQGNDKEIGKEAGDHLIRHEKSNNFKLNRDNIIPHDAQQLINRMELHMSALRRLNRYFVLSMNKGRPVNEINRGMAHQGNRHRQYNTKNEYPFYRVNQELAQLGKRNRVDAYNMEDNKQSMSVVSHSPVHKSQYVQVSGHDTLPIEEALPIFTDILAEKDRRRQRVEHAADTDDLY